MYLSTPSFRRLITLCLAATTMAASAAQTRAATPHTFTVSGHDFLWDGKPYQVISGEMHYPRVPREYWSDRFHKARAMGLNTITTYVFWNVHEPRPGVYDFSGQNDIAEYIREAQAVGLKVILRPGPYVCAEWELGGYPSWLLKDRNLHLRSNDSAYNAAVHKWFVRLSQEIKPLLLKNGGPIIAVQVENEYGSFGKDHDYLEGVKNALIDVGMGDTVLYTANPPWDTANGSLPELPTTLNFGTGTAEKAFDLLAKIRPEGPRMSGEYWAGWFDHWGGKHHVDSPDKPATELAWMLDHGYSVSMYMFHGGTSFGWMNGANTDDDSYQPDTTSYDYDAPLDEKGEPRGKFFAFRDAITKRTGIQPPPLPTQAARASYAIAPTMLSASLWSNLTTPIVSAKPLTFEDLDQSFGYVLYRTPLAADSGGKLILGGLHDYAQVYIDQQLVGTLDRRLGTNSIDLPLQTHTATLDILVENSGRVNFSKAILNERKGLTGTVTLAGAQPATWQIYSLPMDDAALAHLTFTAQPCQGPCFFRAQMAVDHPVGTYPADTYIDTRFLHKGMLWLGHRPLGRFWSIGPQFALYTPGAWLHTGDNPITFFDLNADHSDHLLGSADPLFDNLSITAAQ